MIFMVFPEHLAPDDQRVSPFSPTSTMMTTSASVSIKPAVLAARPAEIVDHGFLEHDRERHGQ
jgi:hypothetical protein